MDIDEIKQKEFFCKLTKIPTIQRIFLYGSRARGDHFERSDIDIAIDCPTATDTHWLTIRTIIDDADTLLSIDCVRYDTLLSSNPLKQMIDQEGVMLYETRGEEKR
jgi:uncharacterized protein